LTESDAIESDSLTPAELALASLSHVRQLISHQLRRSKREIDDEVLPLLAAAQNITSECNLQACPDQLMSRALFEATALESIARCILLLIDGYERALAFTGQAAEAGDAAYPHHAE
jgi:hypothetical protein